MCVVGLCDIRKGKELGWRSRNPPADILGQAIGGSMLDLNEFESRLGLLLANAGCSKYGVREIHQDTKECRNEVYADSVAHGQSPADPFFNFIVAEGVAVFTFFESDFAVYVFGCDERKLISDTASLAMADTDACKLLLATNYGKNGPDVKIPRELAECWLSS
jgi:hypothetical protein